MSLYAIDRSVVDIQWGWWPISVLRLVVACGPPIVLSLINPVWSVVSLYFSPKHFRLPIRAFCNGAFDSREHVPQVWPVLCVIMTSDSASSSWVVRMVLTKDKVWYEDTNGMHLLCELPRRRLRAVSCIHHLRRACLSIPPFNPRSARPLLLLYL